MWLFTFFANITYALLELVAFEVILTLIFTIKRGGGIKFTLDLGMSQFRKTSVYVSIFLVLGVLYFNFSNQVSNRAMDFLANIGWIIIPLFVMVLGFAIFWITKVFLDRKWSFKLVISSIILFLAGFLIILFSYLA